LKNNLKQKKPKPPAYVPGQPWVPIPTPVVNPAYFPQPIPPGQIHYTSAPAYYVPTYFPGPPIDPTTGLPTVPPQYQHWYPGPSGPYQ